MFFKKKKKTKVDYRVGFQNRQFNQKLQQARSFKRTARPIPESKLDKFLIKIGLGNRFLQALVVLLILAVIYIVYIPNFLTVQDIIVEGVNDEQKQAVEKSIEEAIGKSPFYNPQSNLLFLNKVVVSNAALSVSSVDKVEKIHKNFGNKTVVVTLAAKQERFLVRDSQAVYDVYSDGSLKGVAGIARDAWESVQNPGMVKIDVVGKLKLDPIDGKVLLFTGHDAFYINELQKEMTGIPGSPLAYLSFTTKTPVKAEEAFIEEEIPEETEAETTTETETVETDGEIVSVEPINLEPVILPDAEVILPLQADELSLVLQKGTAQDRTFKVIIDSTENAREAVLRLNLLLSQTTADRYNNLNYIDLRLKSRAFVCLNNAPCAN